MMRSNYPPIVPAALAAIGLLALCLVPAAAAVTIHVDCTNTSGVEDGTEAHPYNTIQEGIDAAVDDDTVLVQPCTYVENIDFLGKGITVTSTDPYDTAVVAQTVIDGGGVDSVVSFVTDEYFDSVLQGFTITNGSDGGIYCDHCSPTISHNMITNNLATVDGGGVYCWLSSAIITNNCITHNRSAEGVGAGIYLEGGAALIVCNTISDNVDAGIYSLGGNHGMANNIVAFNTFGICDLSLDRWCNCVFGNSGDDYVGEGPGPGDISADPLFVDRGGGDYHLTAASPCIDAGFTAAPHLPATDMDGDPRPYPLGGTADIGADEYKARPACCFSYDPPAPDDQTTVQFTDCSTHEPPHTIVAWSWDFGDGSTCGDQNPSHSFGAGSYTVWLTVTDDLTPAGSATCCQIVTVSHVPPVCCFSYDPALPRPQTAVQFTDCSTQQPPHTIVAWSWDFGDGWSSTQQNPSRSFAAGSYSVCLTVSDDATPPGSATCCQTVTVSDLPPECCFTYSPSSPDDQTTVQFTDCSTDSDGQVVAWSWDFGDGGTSTEQNPSHWFAAGSYSVCLTVADNATPPGSATCCVTLYVDYGPGDWPMFHHDLSNTGHSPSTAPDTNRVLWSYTTGGIVYSSPAVADGKLYVGSYDDRKVYCLDAATGEWQWEYETGGYVQSSPAVAYGKVYVGSLDHKVYCLDAATGAWQWEHETGSTVFSCPAVADGKVYVGSDDAKVYCLDAATGEWQWDYETGGYVKSSPAVANGRVYVGSWDGKVYCLDAATGAWQWDYETGSFVVSSPAVAEGKVYVGSLDHKVHCLDAATGAWQWDYETGSYVVSSPAVAEGKVYVGSRDGNIYCLDAATGAWQWEYATGGYVDSCPGVAEGKVYVGSDDGNIYCLDAVTGAWQWEYSTGDAVYSSPAVADGKVYVGSYDFNVYCFADDTEPPTAAFEWDPSSPTTLAPIQFTDLSTDPDGTIIGWSWGFGDGGTSAAQHPTHTYTSGGCIEVTLTVTDSDGASDIFSNCVPVRSETEVPLSKAGWHMIAQPHSGDHALADIVVRDDWNDLALPFCDATGAWVMNPLFYYDIELMGYGLCGCDGVPPPSQDNTLRMGHGYWLYTFQDYLTLVFP